METWVLTMMLIISRGGEGSSPFAVIHTQEYLSKKSCEEAKNVFLETPINTDSRINSNKQAYCIKKQ